MAPLNDYDDDNFFNDRPGNGNGNGQPLRNGHTMMMRQQDVDGHCNGKWDPIHIFASNGNDLQFKRLIQEDKNCLTPKPNGSNRRSPILEASVNGRLLIVELILKTCPDCVHDRNNDGQTGLHLSTLWGHLNLVKLFVQHTNKQCLTIKDDTNNNALHLACNWGHNDVAKYIVEQNPDLMHERNNNNETPIDRAKKNGYIDLEQILRNYNNSNDNENLSDPKIRKQSISTIHDACIHGDLPQVQNLVRENPELLSQTDNDDNTPLHVACRYGRMHIIEYITMIHPKKLCTKNNNHQTPFHLAVTNGHHDVVSFLLSYLHVGRHFENYLGCDLKEAASLAKNHEQIEIKEMLQKLIYQEQDVAALFPRYLTRVSVDIQIERLNEIIQMDAHTMSEQYEIQQAIKEKNSLIPLATLDKYQTIEELKNRIWNLRAEMDLWEPQHRLSLLEEVERYQQQLIHEERALDEFGRQANDNDDDDTTIVSSIFPQYSKPRRADEAIDEFMAPRLPIR